MSLQNRAMHVKLHLTRRLPFLGRRSLYVVPCPDPAAELFLLSSWFGPDKHGLSWLGVLPLVVVLLALFPHCYCFMHFQFRRVYLCIEIQHHLFSHERADPNKLQQVLVEATNEAASGLHA